MKKTIIPSLLFVLFATTFFMNGPLTIMINFLHYDPAVWYQFSYLVVFVSYICVIATMLLEKDCLATFNFDRSALVIFILAGFFRPNFHVPNENLYKTSVGILSLVLLGIVVMLWAKLPKSNINWIVLGVLSCVLVIPIALIESTQVAKYIDSNRLYEEKFISYLITNLLVNLFTVAPFEELTIRGILWGLLRKRNFSENKIVWVQGIFFWTIHFQQAFTSPLSFFITIPIGVIVYSLLTRYSKQIFPSIVSHTLLNTLISPFVMFYSR